MNRLNLKSPHKIFRLNKKKAFIFMLFYLVSSVSLYANDSINDLRNIKYRWPDAKFNWYYSTDSEPQWISHEESLELFKRAAIAWKQCGVDIKFEGILANKVRPKDQLNTFGWTTLAAKIRGLTLRQPTKDTYFLKEADIVINLDNADIQNNPSLLQKVITHEFGHALGLVHSESCSDVMSSAAECGWRIANPPPLIPTSNDLMQCQMRYASPSAALNDSK